jgi:hypothetical protein
VFNSLPSVAGAVGLWKQATEVTSDIVNIITKPEDEEDAKFPRPAGWDGKPSAGAGAGRNSANSGASGGSQGQQQQSSHYSGSGAGTGSGRGAGVGVAERDSRHSTASEESWDDLGGEFDRDPSASAHSQAGAGRRSPGVAAAYAEGSSQGRQQPPTSASASAAASAPVMRRNTSNTTATTSTPSSTGSNGRRTATATPTGDDFFATFGI